MVNKAGTKRKKAEKAKVQLKTTNVQKTPLSKNKKKSFKLPKGRNELDTKINAKSLTIPSQLSNEDTSGPSTSKNLPLKHYLIKLKHYARATRLDGLRGIREILSNYPESAPEYLSSLIYKVSPLLSDPEAEVGREGGKCIQMVVSLVEKETLEPFYSVLSAHLCVALSHIDQSIQRTGLKTLDEFIQSIPEFIQNSYKQILPCLLNQISVSKEGMRKLSNKVDCGKMTLLQWRTEVLERLRALFQTLGKFKVRDGVPEEEKIPLYVSMSFNEDNPFPSAGLKSNNYHSDESIPMNWLDGESLKVMKNISGESFSLTDFSHNLLPLLFETWREAALFSGKRKLNDSDKGLLHSSNSNVFVVVVDILQLITGMLKQESEMDKYNQFRALMDKKISMHILPGFPYHFSSPSAKSKSMEELSVFINLKCASIYLDIAHPYKIEVLEKILDYNLAICDFRGKDQDDIYHGVLASLASIILQRGQFSSLTTKFDQLLKKSITERPRATQLIELLSELCSDDSCRNKSKTLKEWILELPKLLVESSLVNCTSILSVIQRLQKQNNDLLLKTFASQMDFVTDKLKQKSNTTHLNETLQLLSVISYRLQKRYPMLTDLVESANDEFTSSFHVNLNTSIIAC